MLHEKNPYEANVILGDQLIVIHYNNSSRPQVVNILGTDVDEAGQVQRIYLDQLVHDPEQNRVGEWRVWGAVSSILERPPTRGTGSRTEAH